MEPERGDTQTRGLTRRMRWRPHSLRAARVSWDVGQERDRETAQNVTDLLLGRVDVGRDAGEHGPACFDERGMRLLAPLAQVEAPACRLDRQVAAVDEVSGEPGDLQERRSTKSPPISGPITVETPKTAPKYPW
jgi:hypothetical protein